MKQHLVQTRQHDRPLHPVQTLTCRHQRIGRIERNILNVPIQPAQAGMITIGKSFALLDHRPRTIDRIKPFDTVNEVACDIASATANIEDMAGGLRSWLDESWPDLQDLRWITWQHGSGHPYCC